MYECVRVFQFGVVGAFENASGGLAGSFLRAA
jgi:hypothetical protein